MDALLVRTVKDDPAVRGWFGQALIGEAAGPRETPTALTVPVLLDFRSNPLLGFATSWHPLPRAAVDSQEDLKLV